MGGLIVMKKPLSQAIEDAVKDNKDLSDSIPFTKSDYSLLPHEIS